MRHVGRALAIAVLATCSTTVCSTPAFAQSMAPAKDAKTPAPPIAPAAPGMSAPATDGAGMGAPAMDGAGMSAPAMDGAGMGAPGMDGAGMAPGAPASTAALATASSTRPTTEAQATALAAPDLPELTRDMDALLDAAWREAGVHVTPDAAPGELLRRLTLDVAGRIPTIEETLAFEASQDPARLPHAVDRLLASRQSSEHLARNLAVALLGREAQQEGVDRKLFERWLSDELEKDTPFDEIARKILGARTDDYRKDPAAAYLLLFGGSPPDIAGKTARFFLGNRIVCAQCHDHPYESWKRTDFWQLAAYFQRVKRQEVRAQPTDEQKRRKQQPPIITWVLDENPAGDTYIPLQPGEEGRPSLALPRFLGGTYDLALHGPNERRLPALANAVTRERRAQFLRAMANRLFAELFGRGVVNPVDDFSEQHAPALPKLLDLITSGFSEGGARWKSYVRALALTRAYARSSSPSGALAPEQAPSDANAGIKDARDPAAWKAKDAPTDPALDVFARMRHKPLSPEQALAACETASRAPEVAKAGGEGPEKQWEQQRAGILGRFVALMARNDEEDPHAVQESIPTALVLMNGPDVNFFCQARKGSTVELAAAEKDPAARVERLYVAAFSRRPTPGELAKARLYYEKQKDATKATEDLYWSLLNSSEFLYNH